MMFSRFGRAGVVAAAMTAGGWATVANAQCVDTIYSLREFYDQAGAPESDTDTQDLGVAWRFFESPALTSLMISRQLSPTVLGWGSTNPTDALPRVGPQVDPAGQGANPAGYPNATFKGVVMHPSFPQSGLNSVATFEPAGAMVVKAVQVQAEVLNASSDGVVLTVVARINNAETTLVASRLVRPSDGVVTLNATLPAPLSMNQGDLLRLRVQPNATRAFDWANLEMKVTATGSPIFYTQPEDVVVCGPEPVVLTARSFGPGPLGQGFRWVKETPTGSGTFVGLANGPMPSGAMVSGAFSETLTIRNATDAEDGVYQLLVGGPCQLENVFSQTATVDAGCPIDYTCDGEIDSGDLAEFLRFFAASDLLADLTGDGQVDSGDLQLFLEGFQAGGC
jgi:hypothetical protein